MNHGVCGATGSKVAWNAVKTLKRGLELKRRPAPIRMKFLDGSSAFTAEDNAEVFAQHFDKLCGCRAVYYDSILLSLPEWSHAEGLGGVPTDSEISLARLVGYMIQHPELLGYALLHGKRSPMIVRLLT